ncbi:MAG: hypothetical protein KDC66_16395, partial [Phaeodactylibacter sp.]|nr:hypothetical protein [Phaeodactylibacter sp.]
AAFDSEKRYFFTKCAASMNTEINEPEEALDATHKGPTRPVPLTDQGKKYVNQAFSQLDLWNRGLFGLISWLETVHENGKGLLDFIIKEYDVEQ